MKMLINLLVKLSGAGKVWALLDGYKAYGSGGLLILSGLLPILAGLAPLLAAHDAGAIYTYLMALPSHEGWKLILEGLGIVGIAHRVAKASEPVPTSVDPSLP